MIHVTAETVPLDSLRPHPRNPRLGNVDVIAESLRVNGQYSPIVVQRSRRRVLAGNHTWLAARRLGWAAIAVVFVDVSDARALEILLADNRASDSGLTDDALAMNLLASLDTLEGTGYTSADLVLPDYGDEEAPAVEGQPPGAPEADTGPLENRLEVFQVGKARGCILPAPYAAWRSELPKKKSDAIGVVLFRLGMELPPAHSSPPEAASGVETVPLDELVPYPGNPRQGDVGLISTLLQRHGQYRPLVVNRRNNRILKGNHVAQAAKALGWSTVGVVYVDVDGPGEKRIVLVDNQSANLATYDIEALGGALSELGSVEGTGFTLEDVTDILSGAQLKPAGHRGGGIRIQVGNIRTTVTLDSFRNANLTPGSELTEAAELLGLPEGAIHQ